MKVSKGIFFERFSHWCLKHQRTCLALAIVASVLGLLFALAVGQSISPTGLLSLMGLLLAAFVPLGISVWTEACMAVNRLYGTDAKS